MKNFENNNLPYTTTIKHVEKKFNADGDANGPIWIYVGSEITKIVLEGTVFEFLKLSIKTLWKEFIQLPKRKESNHENGSFITLDFSVNSDKSIEYNLAGAITSDTIENATKKIFDYLSNNKIDTLFKNSDYITGYETNLKVRMKYNEETKNWEPVNFGLIKRESEKENRFMD